MMLHSLRKHLRHARFAWEVHKTISGGWCDCRTIEVLIEAWNVSRLTFRNYIYFAVCMEDYAKNSIAPMHSVWNRRSIWAQYISLDSCWYAADDQFTELHWMCAGRTEWAPVLTTLHLPIIQNYVRIWGIYLSSITSIYVASFWIRWNTIVFVERW